MNVVVERCQGDCGLVMPATDVQGRQTVYKFQSLTKLDTSSNLPNNVFPTSDLHMASKKEAKSALSLKPMGHSS